MSEKKHTPGPWRTGCGGESAYRETIIRADNLKLAQVWSHTVPLDEAIANARLIAAAPTLFEYAKQQAEKGDENAARIIAEIK
jgi:hypothetical protein